MAERLESLGDRLWVSSDSAVEHHAEQGAWLLWSPICVKDHPIGVLCAINTADRPFTDLHVDFLAVLSAFAGSSIENARLAEQSRYVLLASERDRIAREMHDGVVQSLFSISLGLELCKKQVERDPQGVVLRLDELQSHLNASMAELRRFIYDLRSAKLAELGLAGAIDYWINEVTRGREVRGKLVMDAGFPHLSPWEEACLYRVAKESVSNIVKHSDASHFEVQLIGADESGDADRDRRWLRVRRHRCGQRRRRGNRPAQHPRARIPRRRNTAGGEHAGYWDHDHRRADAGR